MADYLQFWLAKTAIELGIGLFVAALVLVPLAISLLKIRIQQRRCKHDGRVRETMACGAICSQCGKNLGFIGTWRKRGDAKGGRES